MKDYLLISSVYLAVFYIIYVLLLGRDTRYRRNRLYLLSALLISLLLPLVRIPINPGGMISAINENISGIINIQQVNIHATDENITRSSWLSLPVLIYIVGCLAALFVLLINMLRLSMLIRKHRVSGSKMVLTPPGKESGFSALGYIFLSSDLEDEVKNTIMAHEQRHLENRHFLDIIFLRVSGILLWFNPFIYLYERSLKAVHEFEADQQMLDSGRNVITYQRLLLNQVFNTSIFTLQNGFSGPSLIKKRMIMMTKKRSKKTSGFKLLLALPFILMVTGYLSCTSDEVAAPDPAVQTETDDIMMFDFKEGEHPDNSVGEQGEKADLQLKSGQEEEAIFIVVEDMPTFRGGDVNFFRNWVQENVNYPKIAVENGIQGKVFVSFVVDKEGNVADINIVRGVDPSLDDEVLRVVHSSPEWKPGKQRGAEVNVRFSITVNFQLQ